jgi:hypothetical protein
MSSDSHLVGDASRDGNDLSERLIVVIVVIEILGLLEKR